MPQGAAGKPWNYVRDIRRPWGQRLLRVLLQSRTIRVRVIVLSVAPEEALYTTCHQDEGYSLATPEPKPKPIHSSVDRNFPEDLRANTASHC